MHITVTAVFLGLVLSFMISGQSALAKDCGRTPRCRSTTIGERVVVCLNGGEVSVPYFARTDKNPHGFDVSCRELNDERQGIECVANTGYIVVGETRVVGYSCGANKLCKGWDVERGEIGCFEP